MHVDHVSIRDEKIQIACVNYACDGQFTLPDLPSFNHLLVEGKIAHQEEELQKEKFQEAKLSEAKLQKAKLQDSKTRYEIDEESISDTTYDLYGAHDPDDVICESQGEFPIHLPYRDLVKLTGY